MIIGTGLTPSISFPSGSVGIGLTSPQAKLHIDASNSAYLRGGDDHEWWDINVANTVGLYGAQDSTVGAIKLGSGGGTLYGKSGNIGIGTTNPLNKLDVNAGGTITYSGNDFVFRNSNGQSAFYHDTANVWWFSNLGITFYPGQTQQVTFTAGGNVGIGFTSPLAKLQVTSSIAAVTDGAVQDTVSYAPLGVTRGNISSNLAYIGMTRSGVVPWGIGVASNAHLIVGTVTAGTQVISVPIMAWDYNNTRVGVNNVSPSYTLDISGDTRVNGGSLGVNVAPNATDGRIDASNDIVAYSSDKRLKTNIQYIENPLEKINKLSGFTYNWNNIAAEIAKYDTEESLVGVFAQDVQAVLPEAVKLAPFDNNGNNESISGENYLTVQYEKIVPLLIEAIKEQQKQIDELKYLLQNKK